MKTPKTIKRDEIYIGDVIQIKNIKSESPDWNMGMLNAEPIEIAPYFYTDSLEYYRKMLYIPNQSEESNRAFDLLYNSPEYKILDSEWYTRKWHENETFNPWPPVHEIIITNPVNLGNYLKAMGYEEELEIGIAKEIRKKVFGAKHLHYGRSFTKKLSDEENKLYWDTIVKARDRYIREFLLTRIGDMSKIEKDGILLSFNSISILNERAQELFPENKFNRFEPDISENNKRLTFRRY